MAKTSWINRNDRKRETVKKYAALRAELKAKKDYIGLSQLPRDASPTRVVNRCQVSGRRRAFIRRFKISRLTFRELASAGLIPGCDEVELVAGRYGRASGCTRWHPLNEFSSFHFSHSRVGRGVTEHWDSPGLVLSPSWRAIAVLVLLNGFFVAAEFALVKVRMQPARSAGGRGKSRAAIAQARDGQSRCLSFRLPARDHAGQPRPRLGGRTVSRADAAAVLCPRSGSIRPR